MAGENQTQWIGCGEYSERHASFRGIKVRKMRTQVDIEVKTGVRQNFIVADGQDVTHVELSDKGKWREEKFAFCELGFGLRQSLL
jgi:hypothetical protein